MELLHIDGVRLPSGRHLVFTTLQASTDGGQVHAEGEYPEAGESRKIAVSFGPLHGPVSARQVEEVLSDVTFAGYHAALFAGFAFDAGAQEYLSKYRTPKHLQVLTANIAADVLVPDLLKNRRGSSCSPSSASPTRGWIGPARTSPSSCSGWMSTTPPLAR